MNLDSEKTRLLGFALLIGCGLVAVYWPSLSGDYLWDDDTHYTANAVLNSGGLLRTWLGAGQPNYWPLTWTSFWIEHRLVGFNSTASHGINLFLHGSNALLIWRIGRRIGVPLAWGVALLFAFHPANVEGVAWITQRKNLLAMLFALGATLEFSSTLEKPSRAAAASSAVLFAASLLSKGAAVGLPVAWLLIAWWRRLPLDRSLAYRIAPHLALAATSSLVEVVFMNRVRSGEAVFDISLLERAELVLRNLSFYVRTSVAPTDLVFVYPRWPLGSLSWLDLAPLGIWLAATVAMLVRKDNGWRGFIAGQAIFLLMLAPVLGVFDIYFFKYSFVADHYLYLALPAMIAVVVATLNAVSPKFAAALVLGTTVAFAFATSNQSEIYADDETLWTKTAAKNPDAWIAHVMLGAVAQNDGRLDEARRHFEASLALSPGKSDLAGIRFNLGSVFLLQRNATAASEQFEHAVRESPGLSKAWTNLAQSYSEQEEAALHDDALHRAMKVADNKGLIHLAFAKSLYDRGQDAEAKRHLDLAFALDPKLRPAKP